MVFIWLTFLVQILLFSLFKNIFFHYAVSGDIFVIVHMVFTILFISTMKMSKNLKAIILFAFFIRSYLLFFDVYGRDVFVLPHSGADSEMYYQSSLAISNHLYLLGNTRGDFYSDILGIIMYLIGPQRIIVQYINVLLGVCTIITLKDILKILKIKHEILLMIILVLAIFPNSVILSSVLLREAFPTYFASRSLYYFIIWAKNSRLKELSFSLFFLALAASFHTGMIGIIFGCFFGIIFYNKVKNKFMLTPKSLIYLVFIILLSSIILFVFGNSIFSKVSNINDVETFYSKVSSGGRGDASYLNNLEINSVKDFVLYSPIKALYFFASPLPYDWRNFFDIFVFFTDSCLYIMTFIFCITKRQVLKKNKVAYIIFLMLLGAVFVFGLGVSNFGTAMRHRQKLIVHFLVLLSILLDKRIE